MPNYYCVGCFWDDSDPQDQLPRFIEQGIWENGYTDKLLDKVKSVAVGSRIAAKTTYTKGSRPNTKSVLKVLAAGTVTENIGDGITLKVDWDPGFTPFELEGKGAYRSTINQVLNKDNIDLIFNHQQDRVSGNTSSKQADSISSSYLPLIETHYTGSKNQILYGPPGTGKTYNAINRALEIIGYQTDKLPRSEIKKQYEALVKEGRIMFTTFHQSMSYENFIEGIKPDLSNNEGFVRYSIHRGVFRKMCLTAEASYERIRNSGVDTNISNVERIKKVNSLSNELSRDYLFKQTYNELLTEARKAIAEEKQVEYRTKRNSNIYITSIVNEHDLLTKHANGRTDNEYLVSKEKLQRLYLAYSSIDDIHNVDKDIRKIIGGSNSSSYWAILNMIFLSTERMQGTHKDTSYDTESNAIDETQRMVADNYVIIIDEINRGNISQIFGELITLVEDDKRMGRDEALSITLPYSKNPFCVPPNLYIVGTMNTADRSVEALDTALRRRFSFEEMPPRYSIKDENNNELIDRTIGDINLMHLLKTINKRIELLLDKDHLIGHSYFMSVNDLDALRKTFKQNIVPLLQEYFFGDPGKIGLILGKGFVQANSDEQTTLADFEYEGREELSTRLVYNVAVPEDNDLFLQAIKDLLGTNNEPAEINQE